MVIPRYGSCSLCFPGNACCIELIRLFVLFVFSNVNTTMLTIFKTCHVYLNIGFVDFMRFMRSLRFIRFLYPSILCCVLGWWVGGRLVAVGRWRGHSGGNGTVS